MKTYDTGPRTHGSNAAWKSLKGIVARWLDRERELLSLRNAVGMMSEARRADAAEYHAMVAGHEQVRADAQRLRWLTADHASPEVRERVAQILRSIPTRTTSGVRMDIDAAMRE
ncbi:hypothetical protein [Acidovorax sp. NCPPB 4044]|uniref:hypothetical protein n=1 Tax=Acidovorax sp. NCPPB 4044 TaxID=2940490 RepID=UPI002303F3F0|nr:hypothetical protein [Acidovorax sp. NCPPB 4044]MDA8521993.1 hypothetical protein [Acidovorax sp. NCPPB 4044]